MPLLKLPNEILTAICDAVQWTDFESFVLTCTSLHSAATPFISRYNALSDKYHRMDISSADLLKDLARNPDVAPLITHVELESGTLNEDPLVTALLNESNHIHQLSEGAKWTTHVVQDREVQEGDAGCESHHCQTAFLLSLLPNLKSLILPHDWLPEIEDPTAGSYPIKTRWPDDKEAMTDCQRFISEMMWLLVQKANDESLINQPLSRLQALEQVPDADQFGINCAPILPFMALKSLRRVSHFSGVMWFGSDDWALYRPLGGNLERLELYDFAFAGGNGTVEAICQDLKKLRVAKIGYESMHHSLQPFRFLFTSWSRLIDNLVKDETGTDYSPQCLATALGKACGGTLEILSLTLGHNFAVYEIDQPLRSLRRFKCLKQLDFDTSLCYGWEYPQSDNGPTTKPSRILGPEDGDVDDESEAKNSDTSMTQDGEEFEADAGDADDHVEDGDDNRENHSSEADENASNSTDNHTDEDNNDRNLDKPDPTGCPALSKLLLSSANTIGKITIRVAPYKSDMICLERLLEGLDLHTADKTFPALKKIKVYLYPYDHFGEGNEDVETIMEKAKAYLARTQGVEVIEVGPGVNDGMGW